MVRAQSRHNFPRPSLISFSEFSPAYTGHHQETHVLLLFPVPEPIDDTRNLPLLSLNELVSAAKVVRVIARGTEMLMSECVCLNARSNAREKRRMGRKRSHESTTEREGKGEGLGRRTRTGWTSSRNLSRNRGPEERRRVERNRAKLVLEGWQSELGRIFRVRARRVGRSRGAAVAVPIDSGSVQTVAVEAVTIVTLGVESCEQKRRRRGLAAKAGWRRTRIM